MSCTSQSAANPDIDGIGIRVSMYAQAGLALLPIAIALFSGTYEDNKFFANIANDIKLNAATVLATGTALLVASFIQAGRGSLDIYDALIVLQLSWLNNLTAAFPVLIAAAIDEDEDVVSRTSSFWWRKCGLYILHCCATGAFGIWIFHDTNAWSPGCASDYYLYFVGQPLQSNGPNLRIAVLVISSLAAFPIINMFLVFFIINVLISIEGALCRCNDSHTPVLALLAWAAPSILIVIGTEQFITYNSHAVIGANDQSDWTFGQILALLLVCFPLWTAADRIITLYWNAKPKSLRDEEERHELLPTTTPPTGPSPMSSRLPSYSEAPPQRYSQISGAS